jgi:DNA-directed RNA polymerase subunit RPC12/RpoP
MLFRELADGMQRLLGREVERKRPTGYPPLLTLEHLSEHWLESYALPGILSKARALLHTGAALHAKVAAGRLTVRLAESEASLAVENGLARSRCDICGPRVFPCEHVCAAILSWLPSKSPSPITWRDLQKPKSPRPDIDLEHILTCLDPLTGTPFTQADEIYLCSHCKAPLHRDSAQHVQEFMGGRCPMCMEMDTIGRVHKGDCDEPEFSVGGTPRLNDIADAWQLDNQRVAYEGRVYEARRAPGGCLLLKLEDLPGFRAFRAVLPAEFALRDEPHVVRLLALMADGPTARITGTVERRTFWGYQLRLDASHDIEVLG